MEITENNSAPIGGDANENGNDKKKKRKAPVLLIILGILLALILGVVLFFYIKLKGMSNNKVGTIPMPSNLPSVTAEPPELVDIDDPDKLDLTEDYDPDIDDFEFGFDSIFQRDAIDKNVINILLIGIDKQEQYDHGRSDSTMILSFNKTTRQIKLISILRDTWIYIPGRDKWNRINAAYQFGGPGLTINTINTNFDMDIQYYLRVDFENLKEIVDKMGGIDIELTEREIDYINKGTGSNIPSVAGWHHLNGAQTLRHARNRRIGNVDWSRTERQRKVMYALYNQAMKIRNISTLISTIYSLMDNVETNMSPSQIISLGIDVAFGERVDLANRAMPFEGTWRYAWEGRMAVIHIDIPANRDKLHEYIYGTH